MNDFTQNILQGQHVRLDAITSDDLKIMQRWHQHAGFMRMLDARPMRPHTLDHLREEVEGMQKSDRDFTFAIRTCDDDTFIGWLEIDGILWTHRVAGLGIGIGSTDHRGKGLGTEACQLGLRFAFEELNLHRIQASVFSYNNASLRMCEKLGFVREGTYREFLERGGQRYDMIMLGMLRSEWQTRQQS